MCDRCDEGGTERTGGQQRRKLWVVPRQYHCAVIGTCLTPDDLAWMCRRLSLTLSPDAGEYDVHRYFVEQAGTSNAVAKLMNKRLDEKYSGEIRRFARERTEEGWNALWDAALATGNIAPAFWALVSHATLPDSLRVRAYGDVHMLSHLMGGANRRQIKENQELTRRCAELEARVARTERAAAERAAEKDARIQALEAEVIRLRAAGTATVTPAPARDAALKVKRLQREMDTLARRVAVERLRARHAEAEVERLRRLIDQPAATPKRPVTPREAPCGAEAPCAPANLDGQAILYVGGRPSLLPHLRAAVESRNGCLLHHDGGFEQAAGKLEGLVERADVVVCPIDCVSHDACLRVKGLCRRMQKPFVPIRSAGASSFRKMLGEIGAVAGEG